MKFMKIDSPFALLFCTFVILYKRILPNSLIRGKILGFCI